MKARSLTWVLLALGISVISAPPASAVGRLPGGILQAMGWGYGPGYHAPKVPGSSWHPRCKQASCRRGAWSRPWLAWPSVLNSKDQPLIGSHSLLAPQIQPSERQLRDTDSIPGCVRLPPVQSTAYPMDPTPAAAETEVTQVAVPSQFRYRHPPPDLIRQLNRSM